MLRVAVDARQGESRRIPSHRSCAERERSWHLERRGKEKLLKVMQQRQCEASLAGLQGRIHRLQRLRRQEEKKKQAQETGAGKTKPAPAPAPCLLLPFSFCL